MNLMERIKLIEEITQLVNTLNEYRDAYYNHNQSLVEDSKYDELFDRLVELEKEIGYILPNSPTQTVGFEVQSKLNKVKHDHLMLSLDKTKQVEDIIKFANRKPMVAMLKMDGLTCSIHYDENGNYVSAETRGNGEIGEDITLNAKYIRNLPKKINNDGVPYTIDGEVIIDKETFNNINAELPEDEQYSHVRNLASGTIRQLNTEITAQRNPKFIAWRTVTGDESNHFTERLDWALDLGFEVVPNFFIEADTTADKLENDIERLKDIAESKNYPIDGLVFTYEDIAYGESKGMTGHHPNHSIAFKFGDEEYETVLEDIEWNVGRTGVITPTAIFSPVEIDGTEIRKASLHNLTVLKEKLGNPYKGQKIWVTKCNMIIPQITRANKD